MSKSKSAANSSTGDPVACPYCGSEGSFSLASPGYLSCPDCGRSFDPHDPPDVDGDPNAPRNTHGLDSDAIDPDGDESGTFWCPECGARVTRSPTDPSIEYGHRAGHNANNDGERCSRRPRQVDSQDGRVKAAYAMHESMGIGRFAGAEGEESA